MLTILISGATRGLGRECARLLIERGDRVVIRNCGAYTSSYSSIGFNGFPPLDVIVI